LGSAWIETCDAAGEMVDPRAPSRALCAIRRSLYTLPPTHTTEKVLALGRPREFYWGVVAQSPPNKAPAEALTHHSLTHQTVDRQPAPPVLGPVRQPAKTMEPWSHGAMDEAPCCCFAAL